ncbi:MAG: hypothetical protein Q9180_008177, partial [Flavoplaca navasiana]
MRILPGSAERSTIAQEARVTATDQPLPAPAPSLVTDDVRAKLAYAQIVNEDATDPAAVKDLDAMTERLFKFNTFEEERERQQLLYDQVRTVADMNKQISAVPFAMTKGGHIRALMIRDRLEAEAAEAEEKSKTAPDQHEDIVSAEDRNVSGEYAKFYAEFADNGGVLSAAASDKFVELRGVMERRVFSECDMLFATLNNIGSDDFEALGFKPTLIIVDEAGQGSVAALAIPLTKFSTWEAVVVAGDHKQLRPLSISRDESEVKDTTIISPLEKLISFKADLVFLNPQYRMCPAIVDFPSRRFYDGELRTHDSARKDNATRQLVRLVASKYYGIARPHGSEYFWLDVFKGESHPEEGGYSLQNFANVDTTAQLIDNLIKEGANADQIVIISMYKAQARLVYMRVAKVNGTLRFLLSTTADAFQGKESPIIVLDMVAADRLSEFGVSRSDVPEKESSVVDRWGHASAFIKDPQRINVALTRARHGLIVVGQHAFFNQLPVRASDAHETL